MSRPIAISLSPNTESDDVILAWRVLFNPTHWFEGKSFIHVTDWFIKRFKTKNVFLFNSARSAELELLKASGIKKGDEVIVQAFTCVAVANSILWSGLKPVFVDIDDTYNIDPKSLEKKITKKTKAIIIQHTFGIPANISEISKITKKHKLLLFEDCAHSLGANVNGNLVGTFADASFFSFGRDKVVSSVYGGAAIIYNREIANAMLKQYANIENPSMLWIIQQLFHPILFNLIILPTYNIGIGKILLFAMQKLRILSKAVCDEEKRCEQPLFFPRRLPNALAKLAFNQLRKLESFNQHRIEVVKYYRSYLGVQPLKLPTENRGAIWLRFPIRVRDKKEILAYAKKKGILLGDWYDVVTPKESIDCVGYGIGSCPKAEILAKQTVNLPTYPTFSEQEAKLVVQLIENFLKHE